MAPTLRFILMVSLGNQESMEPARRKTSEAKLVPRVGVGAKLGMGDGLQELGTGVGLHAQKACSMLPLTCAHHSASRSADRPQSRRGCGPVSAQPQRGPPAQMSSSSVTLCVRAHDCVPVRARVHVPWCVCVIVYACACVPVSPQRA